MKLELTKETTVNPKSMAGPIGEPNIWFWVRVQDDNGNDIISDCFREEDDAKKYYDGLEKHYSKYKSYRKQVETLATTEIPG